MYSDSSFITLSSDGLLSNFIFLLGVSLGCKGVEVTGKIVSSDVSFPFASGAGFIILSSDEISSSSTQSMPRQSV